MEGKKGEEGYLKGVLREGGNGGKGGRREGKV